MNNSIKIISSFVSVAFLVQSCKGDLLFRTAPCAEGQVRKGDVCVSESVKGTSDCKDPDLNNVKKSETVTLCDGSMGYGKLEIANEATVCTKDGEQDCLLRSNFKALDISKLDASKIANGTTVAGIVGTKREIKQCRNTVNLPYFDFTPVADSKKIPNRIFSFVGGNTVQMNWNHGLSTNDPIQLFCSGGSGTTLAGGVVTTNTIYYADVVSANQLRFQATPSGGALSVTGITGCSFWVIASPSDAISQDTDSIDDYNGQASVLTSPTTSPWGSNYICNESNFTNVSGSSPLSPSNTIPTNANQSWTQIWREELTGVLLTNILYDGSPLNRDWYQLNSMCKGLDSLNGGAGGTGWRLPTQKELLQLYIAGIAKVSLAGGSLNNSFWASTAVSHNNFDSWVVYLSNGYTNHDGRNNTSYLALCVR